MTPTIELKAEPIEGKYYLLSEEAPKKDGELYYYNSLIRKADSADKLCWKFGKTIIASDDKSLNLPTIQWPDEDEEAAREYADSKKPFIKPNTPEWANTYISFVAGRKSNPKKFDEKDMMAAIKYGFECHRDIQHNNIDVPKGNKLQWIQYYQSLTPTIVSVEVEAEEKCQHKGIHNSTCVYSLIPKLYPDELHGHYKVLKVNYQ